MENKLQTTVLPNGGELHEFAISGNKYFFLKGEYHREDGPAIEWANGNKSWYLNGEFISCKTQEEFERLMRLRSFW
jgi:hypothetical protein